jgi:hypothetical protein
MFAAFGYQISVTEQRESFGWSLFSINSSFS